MKVMTRAMAAELAAGLRKRCQTVVLTNGCFDILHAGHVRYLIAARQLGDCLLVGLNSDDSVRRLKGEQRPINSQDDRAEVLAALACVDGVIIFDEPTASGLVAAISPDIYAKGGDYQSALLPEADAVRAAGGKIVLLPLVPGRSTTNILARLGD